MAHSIFLGISVSILIISLAVGIVFAVVKKQIKNQELSRRDLLAVVVVTILTILMIALLRNNSIQIRCDEAL